MTTATTSRRSTFALLGSLYVSQFLGVAFFFTALAVILRERGASLEQIGLLQLIGLPWALKFLWAPIIDRYGSRQRGHYRSWLLVLQPAMALSLLLLITIDPVADFGALFLLTGLVALLSATQDIAADALAVRALAPSDRGLGNGIQVAGGYVGNILGGGAVLVVYDAAGWTAALITLACFTVLPAIQVLRYREPERSPRIGTRPSFGAIVSIFEAREVRRWTFIIVPLLWIGASGPFALLAPMLVDVGWSAASIGLVITIGAGTVAAVAALGSGMIVRALGRRRSLLLFGAMQIGAVATLIPLATGASGTTTSLVAVLFMNVAFAATATIVNTVNMDIARPSSAGSDFTILASLAYLAAFVASALALTLAGVFGYTTVIVGSVVLLGAALAAAAALFSRSTPGSAAMNEREAAVASRGVDGT